MTAIVGTDKNIRHQQNVDGRLFGVLVLPTTNWSEIRRNAAAVADALAALPPGSVHELTFNS